jgi:D-xylonolactonase
VDTVYKTAEVVASSHKCVLGQRPIWDWRFDQFYWIDVYESKIIQTDQNLQNEVHYQFSEGVTNLKLKSAEEYILTTYDSIYLWNKKKNQKELLKKIDHISEDERINDCSIDSSGNIWISSMHKAQKKPTGKVICYSGDMEELAVDDNYIISNGPIFDYEKNVGYVTDSISRIIYQFQLNHPTDILNKRPFISLSSIDGNPDGMTIDTNGNLYVALWGTGKCAQFDDEGYLKTIIQLPVSKVTSCAFGGKDMTSLYITTASVGLNDIELERQPNAGQIFRFDCDDAGVGTNCMRNSKDLLFLH